MIRNRVLNNARRRNHYSCIIPSPLGKIGLEVQCNVLVTLNLLPDSCQLKTPTEDFSKKIASELENYFRNPKHVFTLKLQLNGTSFQQKVWRALQAIPSGETRTYGYLAKLLGSHPRAIGQACKNNPICIVVPCHRIIAAQDIGGYAGKIRGRMLNVKKWLLQHECSHT